MEPSASTPAIRRPETSWLSDVLGVAICSIDATEIGDSRGFLSTTWRLQVCTDPPGVLPPSLVLKSETTDPLFHSIARSQRAFEREIAFYRSLAPAVASRLPRIYGMGDANDPWLLMEDLSHYRAGDQVRGLSHEEARAVVRRLATIHACFWQKPDLKLHGWLPVHQYWFSDLDHTLLEPFLETYGRRIGDRMSLVIEA